MFLVTSQPTPWTRRVRRPYPPTPRAEELSRSRVAAERVAVTRRAHRMPFGAELQADGRVRFRLWAPPHRQVEIELDGEVVVMLPVGEGWHELATDRARAGTRYRLVLPDGSRVPDPAS